jgi:nucleoid-associated protein YgaU
VAQTSTSSTTTTTVGTPATVTMHRLGPAEPPVVTPVSQVPAAPAPAATATDRWTVKPGECFWSIADDVLARHIGRLPTAAEIVPYWLRLIEANRSELAHRDNRGLIFPAQIFVIPAP